MRVLTPHVQALGEAHALHLVHSVARQSTLGLAVQRVCRASIAKPCEGQASQSVAPLRAAKRPRGHCTQARWWPGLKRPGVHTLRSHAVRAAFTAESRAHRSQKERSADGWYCPRGQAAHVAEPRER